MSSSGLWGKNLIWCLLGQSAAFVLGFFQMGGWLAGLNAVLIVSVLGVLEVSISVDNAVVNANLLGQMTPLWQKRFLTWGMAIAVFGMRLIFPLGVVSLAGRISPIEALRLASFDPDKYSQIMLSVHHEVGSFGGAFLLLVCLNYFFDGAKKVHWIRPLELFLLRIGRIEALEVGLVVVLVWGLSHFAEPADSASILRSGLAGVLTFLAVHALGKFLQTSKEGMRNIERASLGTFIYLEVLDASFSFDGVVGAFAITNNLFLMTIGLGIGALFVRSLTISILEKRALERFQFLENGAFYAIGMLALAMFVGTLIHVPELFTALTGAVIIGLSLYSSSLQPPPSL